MSVVKTGHGKVIVVLLVVVVILAGGAYYLFIANGGANNPFAKTDTALRDLEEAWTHLSDTEDDDQDGLNNWFEDHYQTDQGASDSDGDGLSDYVEAAVLRTDPLTKDTGGTGTSDGDEDFDDDGLANIDEAANGLNPLLADSDFDGLNDYNETNTYQTDPVGSDTDGDGAGDGWEIEHGFDPLAPAESFEVQESAASEATGVRASVKVDLASTQAETLHVDEVTSHYFLNEDLPGYLAPAYDFSLAGEFESAEISFELGADLSAAGVAPAIYRFDVESGRLEEQTTRLDGNTAKATVEHFSEYIVVDKNAFDGQYAAPTLVDTDFDGFPDSKDERPLVWDVSDRDLAMFAGTVYTSFVSHDLSQLSDKQLAKIDDAFDGAPRVSAKELRGWKVVDHANSFISGFAATAYKNGDNIVIAFRGTEVPDLRDWVVDSSAVVLGWALQDEDAKSFAERVVTKYQGKTFYVAGHSLGGRLAYKAGSAMISAVTRIATFNGLGLDPRDADGARLREQGGLIADFNVRGDIVYGLNLIAFQPQHYGVSHQFENRNLENGAPAFSEHSLHTFLVMLEPKDRGAGAAAPTETGEPSASTSPPSPSAASQPSATGGAGTPASGFSIEGAWKNIGDSGFGQAQPGATVTFDGVNCNFYSPQDTYAFYRDGEGWRLDVTSFIFAENLSFTVKVVDQDHVEIRGNSTVTLLERVGNAAGSGSGGGATGAEGFSIVGKWKSVGAEGYGQAQPGAVVVFDGENCNFYSPQDSYDFYFEDGAYYLDVISMWFEEFKTYAVTIVNQDQIEIQAGSTTTVLKRVG